MSKSKNEITVQISEQLFEGVRQLIDAARKKVAIHVNAATTQLYWEVGHYINVELLKENRAEFGKRILRNLSDQLTKNYGKGFTYTSLTRMCKVAKIFDESIVATLSHKLSWSHLIELSTLDDPLKRDFYTQMCSYEKWSVRVLRDKVGGMLFERTAIAKEPENIIRDALQDLKENRELNPELVFKNSYILDFLNLPANYSEKELEDALIAHIEQFILELGDGFAFIERQKRIPIDSTDYHLDLLFFHRKLRRLVAIDLKLRKFLPKDKAQMELYLKWLKRHEMQDGEDTPVGLVLCSEGNTEHIELMMLDEKEIRVAQYLTELPSKAWFADKLKRALAIAKMNQRKL